MADHEGRGSLIDFQNDDENSYGLKVDAAAYAAAKSFGSVAVPLGLSFARAASIEMQANFALQLEGAENFSKLSGGPIDQRMSAAREEEADKTHNALLAVLLNENEREQERERDEWARKESSIGGVTMTGAQWSDMAKRLRSDEELQRKLIEMLKARGLTEAEAVKRVERVADVSEAMGVPPNQRNEQQNDILRHARADPSFKQDMADAQRAMQADPAPTATSQIAKSFKDAAEATPSAQNPVQKAIVSSPVVMTDGPGF